MNVNRYQRDDLRPRLPRQPTGHTDTAGTVGLSCTNQILAWSLVCFKA